LSAGIDTIATPPEAGFAGREAHREKKQSEEQAQCRLR
jgi:hypothetical protein